jgi:hypothetical protein
MAASAAGDYWLHRFDLTAESSRDLIEVRLE